MMIINSYRFGGGAPPAGLLLDDYPNAAAAYSLRQLRTGVTNVIRVRESGGNTEADFTAAQITDGTLAAFCGANDGFVVTWYDQSTNGNDATQTTIIDQPQIISGGNLILENGKPTLLFDGTNHFLTAFTVAVSQPNTYFITHKKVTHTNSYLFDGVTVRQVQTDDTRIFAGISLIGAYPNGKLNTQQLFTVLFNQTNSQTYFNGTLEITGNAGVNGLSGLRIASNNTGAGTLDGNIQEFIIYNGDQSTNRAAIETEINTFYGIY